MKNLMRSTDRPGIVGSSSRGYAGTRGVHGRKVLGKVKQLTGRTGGFVHCAKSNTANMQ